MKFIFFTHDIDDGGAARSLLALIKQLLVLNHQIQIVSFAAPKSHKIFARFYHKNSVAVHHFPWAWLTSKFKGFDINTINHKIQSQEMKPKLQNIVDLAQSADVVCFNGYPAASLAGNIQGVKKVLIAREQLDTEDKQYPTIAKFLARHINKGIGISPAEAMQLSHMGIKQRQIFNAPMECPKFCPLPPLPLRFGVFGTIFHIKGQRTLIEACALQQTVLREAKATVHFFGLGEDVPYLLEAIKRYSIADIAIYEGWTDDVEGAMRSLHWIVRPDHDGSPWGRDVLEAMSLGRPVLATGHADCFIKPNQTGILVPPKDHIALGMALKNICLNSTQAEQYAHAAFAFASKEFNPLEQAKKFVNWVKD